MTGEPLQRANDPRPVADVPDSSRRRLFRWADCRVPAGIWASVEDSDRQSGTNRLTRRDLTLLTLYSLLLFGIAIVSGRPLTLHESVLPQTARAMLADHDFVVPKIDAKRAGIAETPMPPAPWLESPPLPQWATVGIASIFGRCDSVAIVRIGPTLVSIGVVLLVAWMSALWFGRSMGLLSGFVMATTLEFTRYAWLAEDEIYLCAVMTVVWALFVKNEFALPREPARGFFSMLFGRRSWWLVAFFVALGATNLVKGLFFGTVMALAPIGVFLLGTLEPRRIGKYVWVWGALLFAVVMGAWPLAVCARYPDVTDVWNFDLYGRLSGDYVAINQPLWYYPVNLLWMVLPWTFVVPLGLRVTWRRAWTERTSPERFLWCWAFVVPAVFSIPGGKHHHYLLHALSPWAIFAAIGVVELRRIVAAWPRLWQQPAMSLVTVAVPGIVALAIFGSKIPGPHWLPYALMVALPVVAYLATWGALHRDTRWAGGTVFGLLLAGFWIGHFYSGAYVDRYRDDVAFLKHVRQRVDQERLPVFIDMGTHSFHGMLGLFYQKEDATLLHNLNFLRAAEIKAPQILLVTLSIKRDDVSEFGEVEQLDQSPSVGAGLPSDAHLTLYRLRFREGIARVPVHQLRISPMQAMQRKPGPFLVEETGVTPVGYQQSDATSVR